MNTNLMIPYPRRPSFNIEPFKTGVGPFDAYYGLTKEIAFCNRCVISNQRPNSAVEYTHTKDSKKKTIHFNEQGICDACLVAEHKKEIDWENREAQLRDLTDRHRSKDGSYDCIVPGSGGKDSFYAAHMLKYKYGIQKNVCQLFAS